MKGEVIEAQYDGGTTVKTKCDFCMEEPENNVLLEKPLSMIVAGQIILSQRNKPLFICLDCLTGEIENI
ncbi:hypothetical protein BEP19_16000 [Ammoniphilus oxalaticus]|uniref:Uncharacterized protein n=1 Tax=Ammoniphilus oxalaticus TaxID=66863 RepID=A0A419SQD6_9BACL|nr:hypothetical protein [Ammoniphilus oxalaticus]RKD26706.1 hypothetical protein BEP19_16000 [Ammoniphilus oxalaticus]